MKAKLLAYEMPILAVNTMSEQTHAGSSEIGRYRAHGQEA
jgi:hypothetical protein